MLVGAFHERIIAYSTFIQGMLTMFQSMLGGYSYDNFNVDEDGNDIPMAQSLYGSIVLVRTCICDIVWLSALDDDVPGCICVVSCVCKSKPNSFSLCVVALSQDLCLLTHILTCTTFCL